MCAFVCNPYIKTYLVLIEIGYVQSYTHFNCFYIKHINVHEPSVKIGRCRPRPKLAIVCVGCAATIRLKLIPEGK